MATYKAVMRPALEYASSVWSPIASSTSINKLQVMHNAALRTATGCTQDTNIQHQNGVDIGVGLHSSKTAVKIVAHIAKDIRCQIFSKIMKEGLKICVIVDEASTISCKAKPVLLIYVKVEDCELSPTIFL